MILREIEKLLDTVKNYKYPDYLTAQEHEPCIVAGEIVSRAAQYYEKARYSVEYKEEHLLRRTAIERILRRRLTIDFVQEKNGRAFLVELIQTGYLPNNKIPERAQDPIQAVIDKTVFFISLIEKLYPEDKHSHFRSLSIKIATTEIDRLLFPVIVDESTITTFYRVVKDHVYIKRANKSKEELDIQTYLACRKGLMHDDETILFYHLWLLYYPQWELLNDPNEENDEMLKDIAEDFDRVRTLIEEQLKSPLHQRLIPKLKNDIIYFSTIRKIIGQHKDGSHEILNNPESLHFAIKDTVEKQYNITQKQVQKSSLRAIIYIFITKMILALVVELPFDIIILDDVQYFALITNAVFHPMLLFTMTRSLNKPDEENTSLIGKGVQSIVYGNGHDDIVLQVGKTKSAWKYITGVFYLSIFIFSFGTILWILNQLHFNFLGIIFFMFFLTFVSYFGLRIRFISRRWLINTNEQKFLSFVWDLFTLPIISLGRWLAIKFASINIFVFIMDFVIEAPFKVVLQAIDTFVHFVKEKKDEIY